MSVLGYLFRRQQCVWLRRHNEQSGESRNLKCPPRDPTESPVRKNRNDNSQNDADGESNVVASGDNYQPKGQSRPWVVGGHHRLGIRPERKGNQTCVDQKLRALKPPSPGHPYPDSDRDEDGQHPPRATGDDERCPVATEARSQGGPRRHVVGAREGGLIHQLMQSDSEVGDEWNREQGSGQKYRSHGNTESVASSGHGEQYGQQGYDEWLERYCRTQQPARAGKTSVQGKDQSVGGQGHGYRIFGVAPEHRDVPEEYGLDNAEHDPMVSRDVKAVGERVTANSATHETTKAVGIRAVKIVA